MYTKRGDRIRNPEAYAAAGGRAYSSNGREIRNPGAYQKAIDASVKQNTDAPVYLYHYTDSKSAQSIQDSGKIKASSSGAMGAGTYLTAKPPRSKDAHLMANNYDGASRDPSKVESYIRFDAGHLNASNGRDITGRDVWKVNGDLDVSKAKISHR